MPGVGLVAIAVMAIVLLAAKSVHEPEVQITAAAGPDEVPRDADRSSADVVPAPRTGETRIRPPVTRPVHPRGAGPSRPRASGQPPSAFRGPSQSP
jgi:hypothetical protein